MMVRVLIWTPKSFKNQIIKIMKISAMLSIVIIFLASISSTLQFNQNPDYNAAHSRFTNIEDNNYLNIINNTRSGFVLPHNSKLFPKGSRILPLFLISQSLSNGKDELERNKSNESHELIYTSTQINNQTPIIRDPENSIINRESLENTEIRTENRFASPNIQEDEFRIVTEQSTFSLDEDEMWNISTEKQLNTKIVSKNKVNNDCYDENDNGPTLDFKINVPVHLRIAKDRNGNGFNLKSIDLGQSENRCEDDFDQKCVDRNGKGNRDQNLFRNEPDSGSNEKNIVEKALKHTEKPFSLVKFVSDLFHTDQNSRKKSSIGDEKDEDLSVEQELFGENGLFDVEETTPRKTRVEGSFWNNGDVEDKFKSEISRNPKETPDKGGEITGEESFETARVIMPLWGETRLPNDGSKLWNRDGLSMQNAQPRLEDINGSNFPQRAGIIEIQPLFDRIMNDGNDNCFPPRGVLSFM